MTSLKIQDFEDFEKQGWVNCDPVFGKPEKYLFLVGCLICIRYFFLNNLKARFEAQE
jgi:hypothetical protein